MLKYYIPIFLFFFSTTAFCQHCGFDGVCMFAVKVTDSEGKPINNLKITILDSLGTPYTIKNSRYFCPRYENVSVKDTNHFMQNLNEVDKSKHDFIRNHPLKLANNNYYLIFYYNFSKLPYYQLKIEDTSKTYYNKIVDMDNEAVMNLCTNFNDEENIERTKSFILQKRPDYSFSPLKTVGAISDKKKIQDLESATDYPKYENFFVSDYVDKTNTGIIALFQKNGSKCDVYVLSYGTSVNINKFEDNILTFTDEYHFGSRNHFEALTTFFLVDLKNLKATSLITFNDNEGWDENYFEEENVLQQLR